MQISKSRSKKVAVRLICLLAGLAFTLPVHASQLYSFTYVRTSGPIQDFSFSFDTAGQPQPPDDINGFMTGTGGFTISPFDVTDGTTIFTFTQARADFSNFPAATECFTFGSAGTSLNTACGPTRGNSDSEMIIGFSPVPAIGGGAIYIPAAGLFQGLFGPTDQIGTFSGSLTLTITDDVVSGTPEPSSNLLVGAGLVGLVGMFRKKLRIV